MICRLMSIQTYTTPLKQRWRSIMLYFQLHAEFPMPCAVSWMHRYATYSETNVIHADGNRL